MYQHFGPYHRARICKATEQFARAGLRLVPIQLFERADGYDWSPGATKEDVVDLALRTAERDRLRWRDVRRVLATLHKQKPALVFVNGWATRDALVVHAWCRMHGIKTVLVSDSVPKEAADQDWREYIKALVVRGSTGAFVGGAPHRRYVAELGMPANRIFDGCDVVDNGHFRRLHERDEKDENDAARRRILTVVRFIPAKNLMAAGRAFLQFAKTRPDNEDWKWLLAGYGPLQRELDDLSASSQGRIVLVGKQSYDDLPALYQSADIYWQPSTYEPWGLAVNEAMAAGLPIIVSTACGCAEDLVDASVGWTFSPDREEQLVAALERAASRHEMWASMGRQAAAKIANWDLDRFAAGALAAAQAALGCPQSFPKAGLHQ